MATHTVQPHSRRAQAAREAISSEGKPSLARITSQGSQGWVLPLIASSQPPPAPPLPLRLAPPTPGRNEEDSDGFRLGLIFFLPPYFPSRRMTSENACDPKKLSPFSFAASFSALASGQAWVIFSYKKKKRGGNYHSGEKNRSRLRALY